MILAVLLQTRSITRAAKRLGMSQPTVSRALGQLRQTLADPLLVRSGGKMTLTQRAVELARPLESWMATTSTLLQPTAFAPAALDSRFVIASSDYGVLSVIHPLLPAIRDEAPDCRIEVSAYSEDMFQKLASGEIDVIITGFEPDLSVGYARRLFAETHSVILRHGHPLVSVGSGSVPLDQYLAWPHIAVSVGTEGYDHVAFCLAELNVERQVLVRVPYFYAAPDLIGTSDAILTMPTRAAAHFARLHGLSCLPAPGQISGFDYWALMHERSVRDPATQWLIDMLSSAPSGDGAVPDRLVDAREVRLEGSPVEPAR